MTRSILLSLLVGISLLLIWQAGYYRQLSDLVSIDDEEPASQQILSVYIDQLERKHFDPQGQLTGSIHTDHARQYSGQTTFRFDNPLFRAGNSSDTWFGQAQSAILDTRTEQITLNDDVIFYHSENTARIHTRTLTIDNIRRLAYTGEPVTLSSDLSNTTATGLQIDFDARTIQLQNNVRTRYQPAATGKPAATR